MGEILDKIDRIANKAVDFNNTYIPLALAIVFPESSLVMILYWSAYILAKGVFIKHVLQECQNISTRIEDTKKGMRNFFKKNHKRIKQFWKDVVEYLYYMYAKIKSGAFFMKKNFNSGVRDVAQKIYDGVDSLKANVKSSVKDNKLFGGNL